MESSFRFHTRWPIGRKLEGFHHNRAPPRRMFAALPSQPSVTLALQESEMESPRNVGGGCTDAVKKSSLSILRNPSVKRWEP